MKKLSLLVTSLGACALALGACSAPEGSQDAAGGAAAGSADKLTIACSQQEDFCQKMTSAFQEASGINTTYVRLGAGEVLARLGATQGEFDVWSGGQAENHLIAADNGWVENYVSPNAAALPEKYNNAAGVWSGFYTDSISFCYNKEELDRLGVDAPKSWEDLLNPKLQGQVAMPHPATAGVGYMVLYTVNQVNGGDNAKTLDYLKSLNSNILQYSKSSATSTEMAGRGEIAVGLALDSDCAKAKDAGFDNLEYSYPAEGTGYEVGSVSVLSGGKNKEAAKQYMDWILSTDAQDLYSDVPSFAAPTNPDAKLGDNVPPQSDIKTVNWDVKEAAANREGLIGDFEKEISNRSSAK
ncbi:ABC transporter substrate-binding protein [Corynebacterium choanae]|uniref:2-aminoethylphosphonate-binding periplasmic protein n=1 Tax=Corynebacterium choanae TaxID=1862358 RepID=A0A3G6J878_9CORY|nr:ABC transporter substrate-binding protein [Corynebacterium choanae]AZA13108.1 Putative 2-aminoethylphosphonate-binding periplasmic protein precursor [Corynebacterium choanae]